jgi:hypothetical protein
VLALPSEVSSFRTAKDIGKCAYGLFRRGTGTVSQWFGVAGDALSGPEMSAKMGRALGRKVSFNDVCARR